MTFYSVQQILYVLLSYFTANHSFLPKAGRHPVFPPKVKMLTPVHNDTNDTDDADDYNRVIGVAHLKAFSCANNDGHINITVDVQMYQWPYIQMDI